MTKAWKILKDLKHSNNRFFSLREVLPLPEVPVKRKTSFISQATRTFKQDTPLPLHVWISLLFLYCCGVLKSFRVAESLFCTQLLWIIRSLFYLSLSFVCIVFPLVFFLSSSLVNNVRFSYIKTSSYLSGDQRTHLCIIYTSPHQQTPPSTTNPHSFEQLFRFDLALKPSFLCS